MFQSQWHCHSSCLRCPLPCLQPALSPEVTLEVLSSPMQRWSEKLPTVWCGLRSVEIPSVSQVHHLHPTEGWDSVMSPLPLWLLKSPKLPQEEMAKWRLGWWGVNLTALAGCGSSRSQPNSLSLFPHLWNGQNTTTFPWLWRKQRPLAQNVQRKKCAIQSAGEMGIYSIDASSS